VRRRLVVASAVVVAVLAAAVAALLTRGGGNPTIQTAAGHRITRDDLALTVEHFHEEADREGRPFPAKGTSAYDDVERSSLRLLIDQAAVEAAAARLGVHVTDAQVEQRLASASTAENEGSDIRVRAEAAFRRATVRAQLITEGVYRKLSAGMAVPPAAVHSYYRSHHADFARTPFALAAPEIQRQLLSARKNAAYARWLAIVRRGEPKPKL
jgi:SurA N-terminal domain